MSAYARNLKVAFTVGVAAGSSRPVERVRTGVSLAPTPCVWQQPINKMPRNSMLALVIGTVGATGEVILLRHQLVNCYPFKILTYPPSRFYERLGTVGSIVVLGLIVLISFIVAKKVPLLIPPVATALAPLLYIALLAAATSLFYGWTIPSGARNFDGYAVSEATIEFARTAIGLAVLGLLIGAACSGVLSLTKTQRGKRSSAA